MRKVKRDPNLEACAAEVRHLCCHDGCFLVNQGAPASRGWLERDDHVSVGSGNSSRPKASGVMLARLVMFF